jgi:hypothetical protein
VITEGNLVLNEIVVAEFSTDNTLTGSHATLSTTQAVKEYVDVRVTPGGETHNILHKVSDADWDTAWSDTLYANVSSTKANIDDLHANTLTAVDATLHTVSAQNANLVIEELSIGVSNVLLCTDSDGLLAPTSISCDTANITAQQIRAVYENYTALEVQGNTTMTGNVRITDDLTVSGGSIFCAGNITAFASDKRLKKNIVPLSNVLPLVRSMTGYTYEWKDVDGLPRAMCNQEDVGLIAQDLLQHPKGQLFTAPAPFDTDPQDGTSKSGQHYQTVKYNNLHAIWSCALNEQQQQIDELTRTVQKLQKTIDKLI